MDSSTLGYQASSPGEARDVGRVAGGILVLVGWFILLPAVGILMVGLIADGGALFRMPAGEMVESLFFMSLLPLLGTGCVVAGYRVRAGSFGAMVAAMVIVSLMMLGMSAAVVAWVLDWWNYPLAKSVIVRVCVLLGEIGLAGCLALLVVVLQRALRGVLRFREAA